MVFTVSVTVQHVTLVFVYTVNYLFFLGGKRFISLTSKHKALCPIFFFLFPK